MSHIPDISYAEAQNALQQIARKKVESSMRPDGEVVHLSVFDRQYMDLPSVGIRLFVNGTWEYADGTPAGGADD